jgi:hypothetical protein
MIRKLSLAHLAWIPLALFALGCESGGVGEPCTPEDEYQPDFSGFAQTETNVESRSFQCETRVCLVNHFQGRVSCPYGQTAEQAANGTGNCKIPGSSDKIAVPVEPQLFERKTSQTVYCSCRCDGEDANARYCECPSGYGCLKVVTDIGKGSGQLAGSYCIKDGTEYDRTRVNPKLCGQGGAQDCGNADGI